MIDLPPAITEHASTRTLAPGSGAAQVRLKPRKTKPFFGRHPWVLDTAIDRVEGTVADGDVVELVSDKGKWVARGIYNGRSRIRVRLYAWSPSELLTDGFWRGRLQAALRLRSQLGYDERDGAARLVFSEADGLSGLIVDRYAEHLVVQVNALAMAVRLELLVSLLVELVHPKSVTVRIERGTSRMEGLDLAEGHYWGQAAEAPIFIQEHGLRYGVDLAAGQKTGFYLDQRENRKAAAAYFAGRRVLDLFCYSGGFGLTASRRGHAREVLAVDTSHKAVALAKANAELNGISNVHFQAGDCFQTLDTLLAEGERFGAVILDPPKFAQDRQHVEEALRAYHRINRLAVDLLEPDGILVTCSCSGSVTREDFVWMLSGVAQQTGRQVQVLEQRGAAADHPLSVTCLENEYLKCFICRVG